jgi:hypothetical protein
VERCGVAGGLHLLAQGAVAEQLGDLGEDLQVPLRRRFWNEQEDQQRHRFVVGCVERYRLLHPHDGGERILQALDASVRNGDGVAQAGGAQAFACKQVVGDEAARNRVLVLEQQAGLLEDALLARRFDVHQHVAGRQDGGESVHGAFPLAGRVSAALLPRRVARRRMIAIGVPTGSRTGHPMQGNCEFLRLQDNIHLRQVKTLHVRPPDVA